MFYGGEKTGVWTTITDNYMKIECAKTRSTQNQIPQPASHVFGFALFPSDNIRLVGIITAASFLRKIFITIGTGFA